MPIGILMVDDEGRISYANALAARMLRYAGDLRDCRADMFFGSPAHAHWRHNNAESVPLRCTANPEISARIVSFMASGTESRHSIITALQAEAPRVLATPVRRSHPRNPAPFGDILYRSEKMVSVVARARHMAQSPAAILLYGETGTGKELFAKAIHEASAQADGPLWQSTAAHCPRAYPE